MKHTSFITASALLALLALAAAPAAAQSRGRSAPRGGSRAVGQAVPRVGPAPRFVRPRMGRSVPYRPYVYSYRPGLRIGIFSGYGYPYGRYYSGYPYGYGYPYAYSPYGYGDSGYYGSYGLGGRGYAPLFPGRYYGGVRIESAARDAEVFADGYYVGIVDDFDGVLQQLNLESGPHHIEIRTPNGPSIAFDVNVLPGQTIRYRADPQ